MAEGQRGRRGEGDLAAMAPPPVQTRLPDWDGLKLRVRNLITSHRVMIFSKSYCPYCNKVRGRRRREPARHGAPRAVPSRQARADLGPRAPAGPGQGAGLREGVWACGGTCGLWSVWNRRCVHPAPAPRAGKPLASRNQARIRGVRGSSFALPRWEVDVWRVLHSVLVPQLCSCSKLRVLAVFLSRWKFGYHIGVQLGQSCFPRQG